MASETSACCFACWNLVHFYYHFVGDCSCDNHHDDFPHCFLGSRPLLAGTVIFRKVAEMSPVLVAVSVAIFFGDLYRLL
jgi:hypothetical protein